jgi:hypothetical protein
VVNRSKKVSGGNLKLGLVIQPKDPKKVWGCTLLNWFVLLSCILTFLPRFAMWPYGKPKGFILRYQHEDSQYEFENGIMMWSDSQCCC